MLDAVVITSTRSAASLKFSNPKSPGMGYPVASVQLDLQDRGVTASTQVYLYEPYGLAAFFDDLAAHPAGWTGEKQWMSIESQCVISCMVDNLGQVVIQVMLSSEPLPRGISMRAILYVELRELAAIASQLRQFLKV